MDKNKLKKKPEEKYLKIFLCKINALKDRKDFFFPSTSLRKKEKN
jgi:hypothetical protein